MTSSITIVTKRRLWLGGLMLAAFLLRCLPTPRTVDDAFITFRYSQNILAGKGFVYNVGERVLGTTTPFYALWMTLGSADYPWFALLSNAFADALGTLLIMLILEKLTGRLVVALWGGALWALSVYSVTFAIGGMETSVQNLWMLAAWWFYLDKRQEVGIGIFCALGVLTRPDALIWALPLLAHQLISGGLPWRTWAAGMGVFGPWLLFASLYFGSPIPHTISTKAVVYHLDSIQAFTALLQHYAIPFQEGILLGAVGVGIGLILYPTLALIGLRASMAELPRALPMLVYPWLYFAVFALANPLMFRWYYVPPLPAYFIAILCGANAVLGLRRPTQMVMAGFALLTLLTSLSAWTLKPEHGAARPAPRMAFHELELTYARMVGILQAEHGLSTENSVAAGDIGAVGFYSQARIFDTIGLVTKGTGIYYEDQAYLASLRAADQNYAIPPDLILDFRPDYLIVMEGFIREGLAKDSRFTESYELIEFIPTGYYGTGMQAFRRKD